MSFTPGAYQKVEIANVVRGVASNLRNVVDACASTAEQYVALSPEAQAEVTKICTVARFLEIQAAAAAIQAELDAALLAYEGPQGLPMAE
jgi:hypothetical protein